jgi:hypothetical protein
MAIVVKQFKLQMFKREQKRGVVQAVEIVQNVEDKKLERTESAGKDYYEEFEDTKGAIRIRISKKNRQ